MDHLDFTVSNFMRNSIGLKRVNDVANLFITDKMLNINPYRYYHVSLKLCLSMKEMYVYTKSNGSSPVTFLVFTCMYVKQSIPKNHI